LSGLRLFTSNRLEILTDRLSAVLSEPLTSPLETEVVVVQSRGMERWISMQLARRQGVCANFRFPFPNHFVHEMFQKCLPDLSEHSPFDPGVLTWRIMKLLPSCIARPGFESLRAYLSDTQGDLKRFQLSERIADTFDQYLLFRPQMILNWEKGQADHWQAVLWRELVKACGKAHRAALGKRFLETLKDSSALQKDLPERISIFGISALPRFHMEIFSGLARLTDVNLFLMNPCRQYWGDIVSDWEMTKKTVSQSTGEFTPEDLYLDKGNSLLGSMGTLGRDFFDLINTFDLEEFPSFEDPVENHLLSSIQSDILDLRDAQYNSAEKRVIRPNDTSIQIHSTHSPMREMEVLYDQLLYMFEKDPDLSPKDILVMTPDIETYSPYIQAVFDRPVDDPGRIPFSIADRSIRKESDMVDAFLAILDLTNSRFGASQVLAVLGSHTVRRKFGFMETDLDLIRRWVDETRIRWGIDGKSRAEFGLPPSTENTWRTGLDRLLLGYAMPGQEEKMFDDVLPYDLVEGAEALVLGRFCDFVAQLFSHATSLGQPRTLDKWAESLLRLLEDFFLSDEDSEREIQVIRQTLNDLDKLSTLSGAGFDEAVDINAIKWHLGHALEQKGFGFGFITGGITFCAMLPMRSIPFKVICIVGLDNDAYPRESKPLGFDLMARDPEPGDRSRRNDDRYLFLEVMLSVRAKLYISYVGQSIQDNSLIPPSVLVSELMDYIEQGFDMPGENILDHIVTRHRLQAFSPGYFKTDNSLFSYSRENFEAAQGILEPRRSPVPFISRRLGDPPGPEWKTVDLNDLSRFFGNPARFLLEKRLAVTLEERKWKLDEREPFEIRGLEKYHLEQSLVKRDLEGKDPHDFLPLARALGQLPHGTVGECLFEDMISGSARFAEKISSYLKGPQSVPLEGDICISGFRLTGRIDSIYPERLIKYRYTRIKPKDRLNTWIQHLFLNRFATDHNPRMSLLAGLSPKGKDPQWVAYEFRPVENSQEILENLLEKYWEGLLMPLHFFPRSSWAYVERVLEKGNPQEDALENARNTWTGNDYAPGECEDAYYQLCFAHTDPLDSAFQDIAEEVFGPLMDHQKEIEA